jgi:hypothetical protein
VKNHFAKNQHMDMKNADLDSVEKAAKKFMQKSYQRKVMENGVSGKSFQPIFLGVTFLTVFF